LSTSAKISLRGDVLVIEIPLEGLRRRKNPSLLLSRPAERENGMGLTPRERQVLDLILAGLQNKEIGARLHICERAVKFHVTSILGKLKMSSRTDIFLAYARRHPLERLDAELDSH